VCRSPAADPKSAGAPEHEIEVTLAMMEAGVSAFSYDPRYEDLDAVVERVYLAMDRLRHQ
jgi:hypothetical protein